MLRPTLAALAALLVCAPALHAQSDSSVAVGVAVSIYDASNPNVDNPIGVGLIGRLRRGNGLGATVGLDWFKSEARTTIDGQETPLGTVRLRPIMVGVSYGRQYARFNVAASVVAGYSFNAIRDTGRAEAAYRDRLGLPGVGFEASNCFVWRPDLSFWYELGNHVGLLASISYIGARPTITTTGPGWSRRETVDVGATMLTLGVAFGIF